MLVRSHMLDGSLSVISRCPYIMTDTRKLRGSKSEVWTSQTPLQAALALNNKTAHFQRDLVKFLWGVQIMFKKSWGRGSLSLVLRENYSSWVFQEWEFFGCVWSWMLLKTVFNFQWEAAKVCPVGTKTRGLHGMLAPAQDLQRLSSNCPCFLKQ